MYSMCANKYRVRGQGAWSSFTLYLFHASTHERYHTFLMEQGFEAFLRIPPCSMRHGLAEALVQWFHAETETFHLSCKEYAFLSLNWTTILGIRFGGESVPTEFVSFAVASKLLSIPYTLTSMTKGYFGPIDEP